MLTIVTVFQISLIHPKGEQPSSRGGEGLTGQVNSWGQCSVTVRNREMARYGSPRSFEQSTTFINTVIGRKIESEH